MVWNEGRGGRSGKKGWKGRQGGIVDMGKNKVHLVKEGSTQSTQSIHTNLGKNARDDAGPRSTLPVVVPDGQPAICFGDLSRSDIVYSSVVE